MGVDADGRLRMNRRSRSGGSSRVQVSRTTLPAAEVEQVCPDGNVKGWNPNQTSRVSEILSEPVKVRLTSE